MQRLEPRILALEKSAETADADAPIEWGAGHEHLPPTTNGGLRAILHAFHTTDAGRLPIARHANNHGT